MARADYERLTVSDPDMSIWEVRNKKQNFVYSKVMLWVAFDRGLRLADKRNLPCPNRAKWLAIRDELYEEVMEKGTLPMAVLYAEITDKTQVIARNWAVSYKVTRVVISSTPPSSLHLSSSLSPPMTPASFVL